MNRVRRANWSSNYPFLSSEGGAEWDGEDGKVSGLEDGC
jgi:hypothetical protein